MENNHIGLAIKRLAEQKKISVEQIANKLSIDRQSVYATYKRANVSPKTIEKYAEAIGVSVADVMQEVGYSNSEMLQNKSVFNEGDGYLMRRLNDLEEMIKFLKDQLSEKDNTIRTLLGKSDNVPLARFATAFFLYLGSTNLGTFSNLCGYIGF